MVKVKQNSYNGGINSMMDFPKENPKNTDDFFNVAELHEDKITDVAQQEGAKRYVLENKLI